MRKETRLGIGIALAIFIVTAAPVGAVTDGALDGNGHPYVGLMVAQDANGEPLWRCSGTLLSPTLFLTAGHCTEAPAAHAEIWFAADVESGIPANGYPFTGDAGGTPYTHPNYNPNAHATPNANGDSCPDLGDRICRTHPCRRCKLSSAFSG